MGRQERGGNRPGRFAATHTGRWPAICCQRQGACKRSRRSSTSDPGIEKWNDSTAMAHRWPGRLPGDWATQIIRCRRRRMARVERTTRRRRPPRSTCAFLCRIRSDQPRSIGSRLDRLVKKTVRNGTSKARRQRVTLAFGRLRRIATNQGLPPSRSYPLSTAVPMPLINLTSFSFSPMTSVTATWDATALPMSKLRSWTDLRQSAFAAPMAMPLFLFAHRRGLRS